MPAICYPLWSLGALVLTAAGLLALSRFSFKRAPAPVFVALFGAGVAAFFALSWWIQGSTLHASAATERFADLLRDAPTTAAWFTGVALLLWAGLVITAFESDTHQEKTRRLFLVIISGIGGLSLVATGHLLVALAAWLLVSTPLTLASAAKDLPSFRARALIHVFLADAFSVTLISLGIAFLFAQYQTLSLDRLFEAIGGESQSSDILLYTGTALWLAGLFARIGGVPFHMVVVERVGAGRLSIAGFASLFLAFSATGFAWTFAGEVLRPTLPQWQDFLSLMGVLTVWAGSLGMWVRPQWRTLIAYSLVANGGWVLCALAARGPASLEPESFLFALVRSVALLLIGFGAVVLERNSGKRAEEAMRGLWYSHPALAFVFLTGFLALASLPPVSGFASLTMLLARISSDGLWFVAVLGGLSTAVAAYPCVVWMGRIVTPGVISPEWVFPGKWEIALLSVFATALWVLGFFPATAWPG